MKIEFSRPEEGLLYLLFNFTKIGTSSHPEWSKFILDHSSHESRSKFDLSLLNFNFEALFHDSDKNVVSASSTSAWGSANFSFSRIVSYLKRESELICQTYQISGSCLVYLKMAKSLWSRDTVKASGILEGQMFDDWIFFPRFFYWFIYFSPLEP